MDEHQMTSSIVSSFKRYEYDVFLSFRGEDTRKNFTSHLDKYLNKEKIKVFIDGRLKKGDEISKALIKAIENSCISIIIFSKNYASSKWCLNELSKIMECKRIQEHIVIPVFYDIDPSHVRNQTESYKDAFDKHKEDSRCDQWRNDLMEAANITGWDSRNSKTEPELLNVIVKDVLEKLAYKYSSQHDRLVGIENSYEQIKSLLKIGSNNSDEVLTLGLWGMGGIGKTTLAKALYEELSHEFGGRCFLKNVRKNSENLEALHEKLYSKLSDGKFPSFEIHHLREMLQRKKVFIVLDDVATNMQLEEVIYQFYPLGPQSRVIVTTRNKQIFRKGFVTYSVQKLSPHDSLELFCLSVFEEKQPKDGYEDISKEVISYCDGIPLALKVMGASLHSQSKEFWECELNKLQSISNMEIQKVLKLSYDDLDDSQQNIFLDIACFFRGELKDNMFPISEIKVLVDKSLITILDDDEWEVIEMHDLIQEMGHEIVRQESIKYPERRSRLWKHKEVVDILKKNKENDVVEGIILNLKLLDESLNLSYDFLTKMTCLRFFKIHGYTHAKNNFKLPDGLESFSDKLRYLYWDGCCLESLPSKFCAEQLVLLRMRESKLKKLWDEILNLVNLKEIDLRESIYLTDIPDLSKAKILELVNLYGCKSLHQLHPSISSLSKLKYLDLSYCSRIRSLDIRSKYLSRLYLYGYGNSCLTNISVASDELTNLDLDTMRKLECLNVNSRSLVDLSLDKCFSLKEISVVSEEITKLSLSDTVISSFSSISSLPKIRYLDLSDCKKIEKLDLHSKSLIELNLSGCSSLKEISIASEEVTELTLSDTAITSLPSSISSLPKLRYLDLSDCKQIEKLDLHSKSLIELDLSGCSSLKEISVASVELTKLSLSDTAITSFSCISSLPKLRYFNLRDCKEIKILDLHSKYLTDLDLSGCSSLKEISMASEKITELSLSNTAITSFSSISSLPNLRYLFLCDCKEIEILDLHSKSLIELDLSGCLSLKEISMIPEEITKLNLSECRNLVSLPELPCALHDLDAFNCISLEREITQRVVLQHMLQKSIPYLHQQQQHHPPKGVVRFVFPGDRVIDDCVFQIAKHSMSIHDFKMSHLSGFIYCFILKENIDYKMLVSIYQDGELLWDSEYTLFNRFPIFSTPISKHMGFWYHDISKFDRENEVYDDSRDVEIKFQLKGSFWGEKVRKEFGVFPVYATTSGFEL